ELIELGGQGVVQAQQPIDLASEWRREWNCRQPRPPGTPVKLRSREEQVLRGPSPVNAILDLRALPHEERSAVEQLAPPARVRIRDPDGGERWGTDSPEGARRAFARRSDRSWSAPARSA